LHQRLDDDGGDRACVGLEDRAQLAESSLRARRRAFARCRFIGIRRWREDRFEQQRRVRVPIERDIGDRQRTERLAVIAPGQRDEPCAFGLTAVAPVVERKLQRDLDRARSIVGIEHATQRAGRVRRTRRDRDERLGELDRGLVREPGQHDVVEPVELVLQRLDDARMPVPEQARPPRTDRVEIAPPVVAVQPRALGACDRHHRQRFVIVHLRARMPDDGEVARGEAVRKRRVHAL